MLLLALLASAADVSIHESLATGSSATTVYGGTFTGSGWRVDDSNSRLYWDFGRQVKRGTVSFTTTGITFDNLTGDNNEFIQMFDTGDKWSCRHAVTMRVYGDITGSSWGDIKLKTWDNDSGLYSEARGGVQDWDGGPHEWTISWDESSATLQRDGVEIVYLDVAGQDLSVGTLWLPLNTWDYGYSHPIGSVYSNLSVEAWEGDEGDDDPELPDDGIADDGGLSPLEDVGAVEWESGVYGDTDDLPLDGTGEMSYLMFDTSAYSGTVTRATLRLHTRNDEHAAGDGGTLYVVPETGWTEDTLTWSNRPSLGAAVASFGAVNAGDTVEIDVTGAVTLGGRTAFALYGGGSNTAHFSSKEDGDGSGAASLTIEATAESGGDDGGADDGSADDGSGDDGIGDDGSGDDGIGDDGIGRGSPDDASERPGDPDSPAACACNTTGGPEFTALLPVLGLVRRRR